MNDNVPENYYRFTYGNPVGKELIVSIDTEWAKNWSSKEKFVPFCITIHSVYLQDIQNEIIDIDNLNMESELYFRSKRDTTQDFIDRVEKMLEKYINNDGVTLIGHQLSSDLHTLVQCSQKKLDNVEYLIQQFKVRKSKKGQIHNENNFKVADTRYDIKNRILGDEKLRNVSLRLKIFAIQTELDKMSLTKMYNTYLEDYDLQKMQKLQTMNWRHAFQTSLVWLVDSVYSNKVLYNKKFNLDFLVTNDIMFEMGKNHIAYLNSIEYQRTRNLEGILDYVKKYHPAHAIFDLL